MKFTLAAILLTTAITVPEIKPLPDETFLVTFERGAVGACTIYTQLSGEGRPYEVITAYENPTKSKEIG